MDVFQEERLENSLIVLRYLRALIEEIMLKDGIEAEPAHQELMEYSRKHMKLRLTIYTYKTLVHFAEGGFHTAVIHHVFKAIEDLEAEQVALGFKEPRKEGNEAA